jgi:hypothetical protein
MQTLEIRLPNKHAEALRLIAIEMNWRFDDRWTVETLAASFLKHVLEDDQQAEPQSHLRVVK